MKLDPRTSASGGKLETSYMQRCIELARNGLGNVAPNPMVGCVIVSNGMIIGEGYHRKYGKAHAEVNAINSVKDKENLKTATLFVNLEPCCYHGKTPPCTDLIIRYKIPNVVIGCTDPTPKVSGKGIEQLKGAGCKVTHGILEEECKELNRRFFIFNEKKRPYIILKWAQTLDGFIAHPPSPPPTHPKGGERQRAGIPLYQLYKQMRGQERRCSLPIGLA